MRLGNRQQFSGLPTAQKFTNSKYIYDQNFDKFEIICTFAPLAVRCRSQSLLHVAPSSHSNRLCSRCSASLVDDYNVRLGHSFSSRMVCSLLVPFTQSTKTATRAFLFITGILREPHTPVLMLQRGRL